MASANQKRTPSAALLSDISSPPPPPSNPELDAARRILLTKRIADVHARITRETERLNRLRLDDALGHSERHAQLFDGSTQHQRIHVDVESAAQQIAQTKHKHKATIKAAHNATAVVLRRSTEAFIRRQRVLQDRLHETIAECTELEEWERTEIYIKSEMDRLNAEIEQRKASHEAHVASIVAAANERRQTLIECEEKERDQRRSEYKNRIAKEMKRNVNQTLSQQTHLIQTLNKEIALIAPLLKSITTENEQIQQDITSISIQATHDILACPPVDINKIVETTKLISQLRHKYTSTIQEREQARRDAEQRTLQQNERYEADVAQANTHIARYERLIQRYKTENESLQQHLRVMETSQTAFERCCLESRRSVVADIRRTRTYLHQQAQQQAAASSSSSTASTLSLCPPVRSTNMSVEECESVICLIISKLKLAETELARRQTRETGTTPFITQSLEDEEDDEEAEDETR